MDDRKPHRTVVHERAFDFGRRDAYRNFPRWSDDLERRMMTDWLMETDFDEIGWLDVRDAAVQGWEERHEELSTFAPGHAAIDELLAAARRRQVTAQLARSFGACRAYRSFPAWGADLEQRMQRDWQAIFGESGEPSWFDVRDEARAGWMDEHERVEHGSLLRMASNFR